MPVYSDHFDDEIISLLVGGGIGVIRTDTLYGLVARANDRMAVERVYDVKTRTPTKSPIVLISSVDQLFDVYDQEVVEKVKELWPGRTSVVLPSSDAPEWLVRGNESVAYRLPDNESLRDLLRWTGPLIAPSANPEGLPPAMDINEAKHYFGDSIDFYVDHGRVDDDRPSTLYRFGAEGFERLR